MTTTPTPRPVPTTEDRMAGARNDRTFATYLDRTERDQLDARAATAEQERDEALDDRDAYKEARDVAQQLATVRQGVIDALNAETMVLNDTIRTQAAELGAASRELAEAWAALARAGHVDPDPDVEVAEVVDRLAAERDKLVETIGRLVSLPPEQIAQMHKVGYSGTTPALGSPPPRAQDEPPYAPAEAAMEAVVARLTPYATEPHGDLRMGPKRAALMAVDAAAPILLAAGRRQAAADIRERNQFVRAALAGAELATITEGRLLGLEEAAGIAEARP